MLVLVIALLTFLNHFLLSGNLRQGNERKKEVVPGQEDDV